jgi:hypothetical protein
MVGVVEFVEGASLCWQMSQKKKVKSNDETIFHWIIRIDPNLKVLVAGISIAIDRAYKDKNHENAENDFNPEHDTDRNECVFWQATGSG